jgi:hypothetical protein
MLLIGDVHQKTEQYLELIKNHTSSVQLGDMGFDYSHLADPELKTHRFLGGNHEDYSQAGIHSCYNALGDFGLGYSGGREFFFVRGAYSIDKVWRIPGVNWFEEEELDFKESNECIELYESVGGSDIILSHDCPQRLVDLIWGYEPTNTRKLLDVLMKIRRPKLWIFGHHHKSIDGFVDGTRFICLNELETLEV